MQGKGEDGPVAGNVVQGLESELCRRTQRAPFSPYHKEKMRNKAAGRVSELGEGVVLEGDHACSHHVQLERESLLWEVCPAYALPSHLYQRSTTKRENP